jgi:hypothetical protein
VERNGKNTERCKMDIFNEKGERIGIKEVMSWWIEHYPTDIFVTYKCGQITRLMQDIMENGEG